LTVSIVHGQSLLTARNGGLQCLTSKKWRRTWPEAGLGQKRFCPDGISGTWIVCKRKLTRRWLKLGSWPLPKSSTRYQRRSRPLVRLLSNCVKSNRLWRGKCSQHPHVSLLGSRETPADWLIDRSGDSNSTFW